MSRGRFIAIEGGEGTGKSTQARLLADWLDERGIGCVLTREPGGTPGAEAIRSLLLKPPGEGWGPRAEALLFAAARSDHVDTLIRPALKRGEFVVCDRFLDSSRAYQGVAGALGDEVVLALHGYGSDSLLPDLTLVIDVPDAVRAARLQARDGDAADAIGGRADHYHSAVNAAFRRFAQEEPTRFALVEGDGSSDEVHRRIVTHVERMIGATQ